MLGVRSHNEPVAGKYAEQLAKDIIEMYSLHRKTPHVANTTLIGVK